MPLEAVPELQQVMGTVQKQFPEIGDGNLVLEARSLR